MVLDNIGGFSLVEYFKLAIDGKVYTMGNVATDDMWRIFMGVNPDVVFVDFCNENAVELTKRLRGMKGSLKVVIRLHGYEAQSWYMNEIDWKMVDHLIVVSPKFKEIVHSKIGDAVDVRVVPNGIDLDKFKLQDPEEMDDNAVAYAGYFNKKKGPTLLRTVMASMPYRQFYLAGTHQDEQVRLYLDDLHRDNIHYVGWVKTEEFLKGKRFVMSTSVTESFGMSLAEGMAMGLTPLVHAWPGAHEIWPKECIWTTFDQLKEIWPKDPLWCRKWIEDRYSMVLCMSSMCELFEK
jgi:glycosyltransferase involved in cell wall biosynthesis